MTASTPFILRLASTFGLGQMRPFPGTWGSIPPVILAAVLLFAGAPLWLYTLTLLAVLVVFALVCILAGDRAEARWGRKDPSQVVADETAGQCLPLLFLPGSALASPSLILFTLFLAFVAFRLFDIFKLWPARGIQKTPGGWGILLDDLVAGLQALLFLQILSRAFT